MLMIRKITVFLLILGCIINLTAVQATERAMKNANNQSSQETLVQGLLTTIENFSREHNISTGQTYKLFAELMQAMPSFSKGGVGLINNDLYVITKESKNKVIIGKNEWIGNNYNEQQLIVTDDSKVLSVINLGPNFKNRKLHFILFKPDVIFFYDWDKFQGGFYKRDVTTSNE